MSEKLPEWTVDLKDSADPIARFVYHNEPADLPGTAEFREQLEAALAAARAEGITYKQAVDDELVTIESTADTYPDARSAVRALIDWHVMVALDPVVSSDACALRAEGMREAARIFEAFARLQPDGYSSEWVRGFLAGIKGGTDAILAAIPPEAPDEDTAPSAAQKE